MEAFLTSVAVVALAEIGDKTQLLAIVLTARFRKPLPIIAGTLLATIANHRLDALVGASAGISQGYLVSLRGRAVLHRDGLGDPRSRQAR